MVRIGASVYRIRKYTAPKMWSPATSFLKGRTPSHDAYQTKQMIHPFKSCHRHKVATTLTRPGVRGNHFYTYVGYPKLPYFHLTNCAFLAASRCFSSVRTHLSSILQACERQEESRTLVLAFDCQVQCGPLPCRFLSGKKSEIL